jgi:hypothetical protein
MYYDRTIEKLACLIEKEGPLRWLFDYVKGNDELDFLVGRNKQKEWISVYRGLSRILTILPSREAGKIKVDAADAYKSIGVEIYGDKKPSDLKKYMLEDLVETVKADTKKFSRYYDNKKEGYYQNILSRTYGISGNPDNEFVIIDKEAVIGYKDEDEKQKEYPNFFKRYEKPLKALSKNPQRYGRNLIKKRFGNEVDFLALDKDDNLLIIEYKHGTNASGIYLSPIQIGLYYDLYNKLYCEEKDGFCKAIFSMLEQKQKIGLIHPEWLIPRKVNQLIPVLIISEFNEKSTAKDNFLEVMEIARKELDDPIFLKNRRIYNYTLKTGLTPLAWQINCL